MAELPWKASTPLSGADYSAAELSADASELFLLDQRALPEREIYLAYRDARGAAEAIRAMVVRGAPAIGITAAYAMVLAAGEAFDRDAGSYLDALRGAAGELVRTRPTAVNLAWAVTRCLEGAVDHAAEPGRRRVEEMARIARSLHREDVEACRRMGELGAERLASEVTVLTHCNAGALATGGHGTALGVIRAAVAAGKRVQVIATETRPYLQGARLTAWELARDRIDVTVITDGMVAHAMAVGKIDAVVVGADRIAKNGDVANKIGTYGIACLARHHQIPFYVAAPWSTVDLASASGAEIVIEEREAGELTHIAGRAVVPEGVRVFNPAFDVTPAGLVSAIVTERGVFEPAGLPSS